MKFDDEHFNQIETGSVEIREYTERIIKLMRQKNNFLIVGLAGAGKTSLIQHVERQINKQFPCLYLHVVNLVCAANYQHRSLSEIIKQQISRKDKQNQGKRPIGIILDQIDQFTQTKEQILKIAIELMQFLSSSQQSKHFLIGITNQPWRISPQILKLFPTKILIDLPNFETRRQIISRLLQQTPHTLSQEEITIYANLTEKFSPCDLNILVRTASYYSIKQLMKVPYFKQIDGIYYPSNEKINENLTLFNIKPQKLFIRKLTRIDFQQALKEIKPSSNQDDICKFNS